MRRLLLLILLLGIVFVAGRSLRHPQANSQSDAAVEQIVRDNFPSYFTPIPPNWTVRPPQKVCYAVYSQEPGGPPLKIIAAYIQHPQAAVRILQRMANGTYAVSVDLRPDQYNFGGGSGCTIELLDMNGDGKKDVCVSFDPLNTGPTVDWYFRWDPNQLWSWLPNRAAAGEPVDAGLPNTIALDLQHDGRLEIISLGQVPADSNVSASHYVYRLGEGVYVFDREIPAYFYFERQAGDPAKQSHAFTLVAPPSGNYVMKLVNGDRGGANRVTGAQITLNGTQLGGLDYVNGQVEFRTRSVTLAQSNLLEVTVFGPTGAKLYGTIEPAGSAAASSPARTIAGR